MHTRSPGRGCEVPGAPTGRPQRVLVVSAGMGAGHHAIADELVRRLRQRGHAAERIDVLHVGRPGQGRRLRQVYLFLLRRLPWVYGAAMRFWARWPAPLEALTAHGATAYEEGLLREIRRFDPDVVVSVFNLASQALGRLRARGQLTRPVVTYLSDPGPHPYWVHPAVDLYLVPLAETARGLTAYGARRTAVVAELVRPRFADHPVGRAEARRRLGLPLDADIVLVSGGSLATGPLQRTVGRLARAGVLPVTLCGTDAALRRRLSRRRAGVALGWTDDVAAVMAAADVLVDNAGGVTCAEALASGLPVVLFRPLPGHGRLSAETLDAAGVAPYARTDHELISLVRVLCARRADGGGRPVAPRSGPRGDAVDAVLELGLSAAGGPRP